MDKKEQYKYISFANFAKYGCTFAYADSDGVITSDTKGIKRLLSLANDGVSLENGYVCDIIIGKAAALLMVYLGVKNVYGETVSRYALDVFAEYGVNVSYKFLVPVIINRKGDDICPMEKAVLGVNDPTDAFEILTQKVAELSGK